MDLLLGDAPNQLEHRRWAYVLLMVLAFVVFAILRRLDRAERIDRILPFKDRFLIAWGGFIGGAFGAKIPFAIYDPSGIMSLEAWVADGKTIMTALMGGYLGVEGIKLLLGVKIKTGDGYAAPLAAGLAVGRLGCFFNGCCFGVPTELPWGVDFGLGPAHPTQLYEVVFHATCAIVLWSLPDWEWLRYQRLKLYLIAYCCYRFMSEFIRPEPEVILGLTFYQLVAILFAALLGTQWWFDEKLKRKQREQMPPDARLQV